MNGCLKMPTYWMKSIHTKISIFNLINAGNHATNVMYIVGIVEAKYSWFYK